MAGTITYDTVGSSFSAGVNGDRWRRRYIIEGMTSGPDIPSLISEAYLLLPDTWTAAPAPLAHVYVDDAVIDRIWCLQGVPQTWSAEGSIIYQTPTFYGGGLAGSVPDDNGPGVTLSTSSSLQEIDVFEDVNAAQIITTNDNVSQAHRVTGFSVSSTLTFTRVETTNPRARIDAYSGKLNTGIWNGYSDRTVLCENIDARTDDGGLTYVVTYTFVYRPDGWDATVVHDDPFFPGNPIPLSEADDPALARKFYQVTDDISFVGLSIVLP